MRVRVRNVWQLLSTDEDAKGAAKLGSRFFGGLTNFQAETALRRGYAACQTCMFLAMSLEADRPWLARSCFREMHEPSAGLEASHDVRSTYLNQIRMFTLGLSLLPEGMSMLLTATSWMFS